MPFVLASIMYGGSLQNVRARRETGAWTPRGRGHVLALDVTRLSEETDRYNSVLASPTEVLLHHVGSGYGC